MLEYCCTLESESFISDVAEYLHSIDEDQSNSLLLDYFIKKREVNNEIIYEEIGSSDSISDSLKKNVDFKDITFKVGFSDKKKTQLPTGEEFSYEFYQKGEPVSASLSGPKIFKVLKLFSTEKSTLKKIIANVYNFHKQHNAEDKIIIFSQSISGNNKGWKMVGKQFNREIDSVFHDQKEKIINDIEEFLASENDYRKYGIPYKRNYLFYGPPGGGKTSMITAIASKYKQNIYLLSVKKYIEDDLLKKLINSIPVSGFLVIEDIDSMLDDDSGSKNFSSLLNILDGLARKHCLITFLTTNNRSKLGPILTRPGRIDFIEEFPLMTKTQFNELYKYLRPDDKTNNSEWFYERISSKKPSMAMVQKFLFEKRKISDIKNRDLIREFENLINQFDTGSNNYTALYS